MESRLGLLLWACHQLTRSMTCSSVSASSPASTPAGTTWSFFILVFRYCCGFEVELQFSQQQAPCTSFAICLVVLARESPFSPNSALRMLTRFALPFSPLLTPSHPFSPLLLFLPFPLSLSRSRTHALNCCFFPAPTFPNSIGTRGLVRLSLACKAVW